MRDSFVTKYVWRHLWITLIWRFFQIVAVTGTYGSEHEAAACKVIQSKRIPWKFLIEKPLSYHHNHRWSSSFSLWQTMLQTEKLKLVFKPLWHSKWPCELFLLWCHQVLNLLPFYHETQNTLYLNTSSHFDSSPINVNLTILIDLSSTKLIWCSHHRVV